MPSNNSLSSLLIYLLFYHLFMFSKKNSEYVWANSQLIDYLRGFTNLYNYKTLIQLGNNFGKIINCKSSLKLRNYEN